MLQISKNNSIRKTKFSFLILLLFSLSFILAQGKGKLTGKVIDSQTGEGLIGANVMVVGTTLGSSTDIDGVYLIKGLEPGKYTVKVSYISYQNYTVSNVKIEAGKETTINVELLPTTTEIKEVVVTAEALKSTETAILNIQKNSLSIVDGVSAELIKKNSSSDGTDILKRMTGVTIADGKYAYIRGVSDRYNSTMLNGANLPSTDPEKKSVSYDLFPSALIENVITNKTATADKRADFSGGLVQINTVEFPSKFFAEIGAGNSYNKISNLKDGLSYSGGKYDFLGFDDGTRKMPSAVPGNKVDQTLGKDRVQEIGRAFSNNWDTKKVKTALNTNLKLSMGNSLNIGEGILGFIGSLTYSNNTEVKDYDRNYYNYDGPYYNYKGMDYNTKVMLGGLVNISYKFSPNHKISFKNIYNQNTDNYVITNKGNHYYVPEHREATTLQFLSRSLYSTQLVGEHVLNFWNNSTLSWNVNFSTSKRDEPDTRKYFYSRDLESSDSELRFAMNQATDTRFFSELNDKIYGGSTDFTFKPFENPSLPNFKLGFMFDHKTREYSPRVFGFDFNMQKTSIEKRDNIFKKPIQEIFTQENINPDFIYLTEVSNPTDRYSAKESVFGAYAMFNATLFEIFKVTGGLRYEASNTDLSYINPNDYSKMVNVTPKYNDILPSLNATVNLNQQINLRGAYGRTLARPELRELARSGYYDFLTDDYVFGNPDLKRTVIDNFDLRAEYYPSPMELFAVNFFYKNFDKPIEIIGTNASGKTRTWKNADKAYTYGVEFELRKGLGFIYEGFNYLSFISNISLIKSEVDLGQAQVAQAELEQKRSLQGQANYILNMGLYYDDYESGLTASLVYNKVGEKILTVGVDKSGDIVEKPRDQFDFNISKKLFSNLNIKLSVKDILAQDQETIQKTALYGDRTADKIKRASTFSVGLTYTIN